MKLSPTGLDFIKGFESFVPYVYDDLVPPVKGKYREWDGGPVKGTLTIGYGHTDAARHPLKIKQGLRITEAEARQILAVDISECEDDVERLVTKPLTQGQYDACVSFTFNCGAGSFKNIAKRINAGNYAGARAAFDLYTKSKGKVLRGLQRRRDGEQVLWDSDIPTVPTEVVDHPAEVDDPKKPTTKELTKVSRKAKWLVYFRRIMDSITATSILGGLGVATSTSSHVKQLVPIEAIAGVITVGLLLSMFAAYIVALIREDVEEGRATPSGEVEAA
jgi:lysozyme